MRKRKHNIEWRRGRQGEGFYLDFTIRGYRVRAFGGRTLREAKLELGRLRAEKTAERKPPSKDMTLENFGREFLEVYSKPGKKSWRRDAVSLRSLAAFFKNETLRSIDAAGIERFKAYRRSKVSPATVNRELACLKTVLNKAVEWGRLEHNPAAKIRKFKEAPAREKILTAEESSRLIAAAAPHLKPLLVLLLGTGMRRGEALTMRWEDVDFGRGFIHVGDSKNGRSRNIPMSHVVRSTLEILHEKTHSEFTFNGLKDVKRSFRTASKGAGIKGLRLHDLRHTAASRMVEAGVDIVTVSEILGHSSITMTRRYCHPTPENVRLAVEKLSEKLTPNRWTEAASTRQIESTSIN